MEPLVYIFEASSSCKKYFKNSVLSTHIPYYVSNKKANQLMLSVEIIVIYTDNYMKHTNTPCEQNAICMSVEGDCTYRDQEFLRVKILKF
jgi:hypothetical protein